MSTNLYVKSCYSLLESTIRLPELVEKAKQCGFTHLALTDRKVMFGVPHFLALCKDAGIHGIVGLEADVYYHEAPVPFLLLARDTAGYRSLMALSSFLNEGNDTISVEQLKEACQHCILIAYGEGGWMDSAMVNNNHDEMRSMLETMKAELPEFDMALSYQDAYLWKSMNSILKGMCVSLGIHTAALNKTCYLNEGDADLYRALTGIKLGVRDSESSLQVQKGKHFLTKEELSSLYDQDDLMRTDELAEQCRTDYVLPKADLPAYIPPNGMSAASYLPALCNAGLKKRLNNHITKAYADRLSYELSVISRMHFENYFLIVYDLIRYARNRSIYVGPGRGSAAGSLCAYCLGITQVDPLKYNLLFERFLNPERVSMPDIDTDLPDDRREEVLNYLHEKYGDDCTANIVTFNTYGARQALNDAKNFYGADGRSYDALSRLVPAGSSGLGKMKQNNRRLAELVESNGHLSKVYRLAEKLEGLPRHTSVHAAGVILSNVPLTEEIPVMRNGDGMRTSQYPKEFLEERGLIKMDLLGLRNLSIIDEVSGRIQKTDPDFRIMHIPLDEPKVYQLFCRMDTNGVFQFETDAMKSLLRKVQPGSFEDLCACLGLIRPSSIDSVDTFVNNRRNPERIVYPKGLKDVLSETYGVMIFQEQAMKTAEIAAGFSLGKADVLRKAMSKKNEAEVHKLKGAFLDGCRRNGYSSEEAESLFALVEKFAGYGFNKSHAVAYGMVSYQMAYLKAVYPYEFYISIMNSVVGNEKKTSVYADECRRRKLKVHGPDVNASEEEYVYQEGSLIMPLGVVKGFSGITVRKILEDREKNGLFADFFDFCARASLLKIDSSMIVRLADAGALDCFGLNRATMRNGVEEGLRYAELSKVKENGAWKIVSTLVSKPVLTVYQNDAQEEADLEREALGFCVGVQPVTIMRNKLNIHTALLSDLSERKGYVDGFGVVSSIRQHRTKRGDLMAFMTVSDESGRLDLAVMPELYAANQSRLVRGVFVLFSATISDAGSALAKRLSVMGGK